jgi:cell cycle checkpoint protein
LEENGVVSNCALKTLDAEELQNFNFRSSPILIMEAEYLKDAFNELDWSSKQVRVLLSPDPPYFRLSTQGPSGSCQVMSII